MNTPTTTSALSSVTEARVTHTRRRAEAAIRELDKQGWPVTFASVAAAASVSRSWLYREPDIRAEIDRLRTRRGDGTSPSVERASADSIKRQREALIDELTILKEENRRLREEVARAYGQQRASAGDTVKDMSTT